MSWPDIKEGKVHFTLDVMYIGYLKVNTPGFMFKWPLSSSTFLGVYVSKEKDICFCVWPLQRFFQKTKSFVLQHIIANKLWYIWIALSNTSDLTLNANISVNLKMLAFEIWTWTMKVYDCCWLNKILTRFFLAADVPWEIQNKGPIWIDVFTLHPCPWIVNHRVDISIWIDVLSHPDNPASFLHVTQVVVV